MVSKEELGKLIKKAREFKSKEIGRRYTQKMLADDINKSQGYIGDIESGRTYPTLIVLGDIAQACGLPVSFFSDIERHIDDYLAEKLSEYPAEVHEIVKKAMRQRSDIRLDFLNGLEKDSIRVEGFLQKKPTLMEDTIPYIPYSNVENIPIVGIIRAGEPILATQNFEGYLPTDKQFIKSGGEYFYLRVKGDSMDKEFQEGSLVLIKKQPYIENGQIGAVLIDNEEATVKKVYINENIMTLVPVSNNMDHQPRIINMEKEEVSIIGRVVLAVKKY